MNLKKISKRIQAQIKRDNKTRSLGIPSHIFNKIRMTKAIDPNGFSFKDEYASKRKFDKVSLMRGLKQAEKKITVGGIYGTNEEFDWFAAITTPGSYQLYLSNKPPKQVDLIQLMNKIPDEIFDIYYLESPKKEIGAEKSLSEIASEKYNGQIGDYKFNLKNLANNGKAWKELEENIDDLMDNGHVMNYFDVRAKINDEEEGYLWDAGVTIKNGRIIVDGSGYPSGMGGYASLSFDKDGGFNKVVKKSPDFAPVIDENVAELEAVIVDASPELLKWLKINFG